MSRRIPGYLRHKARNKAKVIIDRKTIDLDGDYGSPESRRHYDRLIAELLSKPENRPDLINVTIARLAVSYVAYAKGCYQKDGDPTPERGRYVWSRAMLRTEMIFRYSISSVFSLIKSTVAIAESVTYLKFSVTVCGTDCDSYLNGALRLKARNKDITERYGDWHRSLQQLPAAVYFDEMQRCTVMEKAKRQRIPEGELRPDLENFLRPLDLPNDPDVLAAWFKEATEIVEAEKKREPPIEPS